MSRLDLIRLYTEGQLPRRDFIRKLTLAGVSAGAAAAYAQTLAPSASAATGALLVQQAGEDYGGPIDPGDLEEAIQALISLLDAIIDFLTAALDGFEDSDFADFLGGVINVLQELLALNGQLQDERNALEAGFPGVAGLSASGVKRQLPALALLAQDQSVDAFVADLGDALDVLTQLYAGILIAAEDVETRQLLAGLAIVKGEQAAFVRLLRGLSPFPTGVVQPIDVAEAQDRVDEILAD